MCVLVISLKKDFMFRAVLGLQQSQGARTESPIYPCPYIPTTRPRRTAAPPSVRSRLCTCQGLRRWCNVGYPPLRYHTEQCHCPDSFLCSIYSCSPEPHLWQSLISSQFCLFQNVILLESDSMSLSLISFFHSEIGI